MPVKIFISNSTSREKLDEQISEWEEDEGVHIIDMDYSISAFKEGRYRTSYIHGVILRYEKIDD